MSIILHLLTSIEVLDVYIDDCKASYNHRPLLVIDYSVFKDPTTTSDLRATFPRVTGRKLDRRHFYIKLEVRGIEPLTSCLQSTRSPS